MVKVMYQYKFNQKEFQDELGLNMYDYGARNYDPALGRFFVVDPLAEQFPDWSPYAYAFNSPVNWTDPTGMAPEDWKKDSEGNYIYDSFLTKENASSRLGENETYVGASANINVMKGGESLGSISLNKDGTIDVSEKLALSRTIKYSTDLNTGVNVVDAGFKGGGKIYGVAKDLSFGSKHYGKYYPSLYVSKNFIGDAKEIYNNPIEGRINAINEQMGINQTKINNLLYESKEHTNQFGDAVRNRPSPLSDPGGRVNVGFAASTLILSAKASNKAKVLENKNDSLNKVKNNLSRK
ncbi:MAG: RHS repeat-associated core domain-containing protein [Candidatus Kapabacteria bacterium]|jgi:RHS repeat-associated protein|nr:RHS repeat-associated core domain-containing protein [Candidatus Kapabacteria bacterium]